MVWFPSCALTFAVHSAKIDETPTGLFQATVPPDAVLALLCNWHEQEVVVNSNRLQGRITLVEEIVLPVPAPVLGGIR